jgi:hypothetical protein
MNNVKKRYFARSGQQEQHARQGCLAGQEDIELSAVMNHG